MANMFDLIDRNHDGSISRAEFEAAFRGGSGRGGVAMGQSVRTACGAPVMTNAFSPIRQQNAAISTMAYASSPIRASASMPALTYSPQPMATMAYASPLIRQQLGVMSGMTYAAPVVSPALTMSTPVGYAPPAPAMYTSVAYETYSPPPAVSYAPPAVSYAPPVISYAPPVSLSYAPPVAPPVSVSYVPPVTQQVAVSYAAPVVTTAPSVVTTYAPPPVTYSAPSQVLRQQQSIQSVQGERVVGERPISREELADTGNLVEAPAVRAQTRYEDTSYSMSYSAQAVSYAAPAVTTYAAPVTSLAYAAPATDVFYAAPPTTASYAAPATVSYTAAPTTVTYAAAPTSVAYATSPTRVAYSVPEVNYSAPISYAPAQVTYASPPDTAVYTTGSSVRYAPQASYSSSAMERDTECPNCGNIYMADSKFCRRCGHSRGDHVVQRGFSGSYPQVGRLSAQPVAIV